MALKLTNATDYAIRIMQYIGSLPQGRIVHAADIAEAEDVPPSFAFKVLRTLARRGLLRSMRGPGGGFALAREASEISLLDVVECVEGPIQLLPCTGDASTCGHECNCPAAAAFREASDALRDILARATLEDLLSRPRRHGLRLLGIEDRNPA